MAKNRVDTAGEPRPHISSEAIAASADKAALTDHARHSTLGTAAEVIGPVEDAGPIYLTEVAEPRDTHAVERRLQYALMAHPEVTFSSLVVRRIEGGVCLQGVLEYEESEPDVCGLVRRVAGVQTVLNRLVIRQSKGVERPKRPD